MIKKPSSSRFLITLIYKHLQQSWSTLFLDVNSIIENHQSE